MQKVSCDKCKQYFEIKNKKKFYNDGTKGKVVIHFFACTHCDEKYPIKVESDKINKLFKKQQNFRKKIPKTFDDKKLDEIYHEMETIKQQIKKLQNEYKLLFKFDKE